MMRRIALPVILIAASLLAVCAPASRTAAQAPADDVTLDYDGLTRSYTLTVPDDLDPAEPAPLLIALHPFASSGKALRALSGLDALAERDGFLIAYPDSADLYWDDGRPRPTWYPAPQSIDDVGFLGALIDDVSARYAIDAERVVLVGLAGGGTLAFSAACQMPERLAGVAVVGATTWDYHVHACPEESAPVPLLILLGGHDPNIQPNDPDTITLESAQALDPAGAAEPQRLDLVSTLMFWISRFQCALTPPDDRLPGNVVHYDDCDASGSVTMVALPGGGANWSRPGDYTLNQSENDASAMVVDFLLHGADPFVLSEKIMPAAEMWGGRPRSYTVYVPHGYDAGQPMPLLVALHGRGGNGAGMAYLSQFNELAEREGVIIAYPDGLNNEWSYLAGTSGIPASSAPDDVGFLTRLVGDLARDLAIDRQRVYVTGFSNGGFMTQRLACEAQDTFAAFGSVGATFYPGFVPLCEGALPVPILLMHGTLDPIVSWEGARYGGTVIAAPMPDTAIFWAEHNECDPDQVVREEVPKEDPAAPTQVFRYHIEGCAGRGSVLYEVIEGGGHTLPGVAGRMDPAGVGETNMDINTGEELWTFFAAHPFTE